MGKGSVPDSADNTILTLKCWGTPERRDVILKNRWTRQAKTKTSVLSSAAAVCLSQASDVHHWTLAPIREAGLPGGGTERAPRPAEPRPAQVPGRDAETDLFHAESTQTIPQVTTSTLEVTSGQIQFRLFTFLVGLTLVHWLFASHFLHLPLYYFLQIRHRVQAHWRIERPQHAGKERDRTKQQHGTVHYSALIFSLSSLHVDSALLPFHGPIKPGSLSNSTFVCMYSGVRAWHVWKVGTL